MLIFMINFLVSSTAFCITNPLISPFFVLLYSSTRGSMILNHSEGNRDKNMQTEYPWGKWGDYSRDINVWYGFKLF